MTKQTFTTGQVLTAAQMTSLQQTAMGGGSTTAKTTSYVLVAADAGTVVQMNSASATTITVNTALFAAGDTVQIQNVGAGVCTVTAGTATVSTSATLALKQYDAGTLYFNTTSAAFFFAVDAADASASGLTLIKRSSFSAVTTTTTTFDSLCTSTYKSYLMVIENMSSSTANANIYLQFRKAAVTHTTNYYAVAAGVNTAGAAFSYLSSAASQGTLFQTSSSASDGTASMTFNLMGSGSSQIPQGHGTFYEQNASRNGQLGISTASSILADGWIFSASAGTITGTVAIYGLAIA